MNKNETWKSKFKEVSNWSDATGTKMDREIIETVTALNLLGFETLMSCSGHLKRNLTPSVVIKNKDLDTLFNLLVKFYLERMIDLENMVILHQGPNLGVLQTSNNFLINILSGDSKKLYLKKCQTEMKDFGKFLKNVYLTSKL